MKNRNIFLGLLFIVTLGIGIIAYWWFRPGVVVEEVLPQGAVAFVRLSHGVELWDDFLKSSFYQKLSAMDIEKVIKRNSTDPRDLEDFYNIRRQWEHIVDNPWIRRVLGKEVVVAFYEDKNKGIYPVILIRLDHTLQTAQLAVKLLQPASKEIEISQQQYRGVTVDVLTAKKYKQQLYYKRFQDVLVLVQNDIHFLDGVIDRSLLKEKALSQDANWQFMKNNAYQHADAEAYVNLNTMIDRLKQRSAMVKNISKDRFDNLKVMSVSFSHQQVSRFKFALDTTKQQQPCPDNDNQSISLVPANAIAYNWGNCYDFSGYWQALKENLKEYPVIAKSQDRLAKAVKRHFGVDLEKELLPLIGHDAGGYLTEIDSKAIFPYPRMLFFLKMNDIKKITVLLDTVKTKLPIDLLKEQYQGVDINYFNFSVGSNTDPGYCMIGDYLLVATSRQLLKKSIDTHAVPARSLGDDKLVKELGITTSKDVNAITLLRTSAIIRRAKVLSDWADKFLASQVSMASAYQKEWSIRKNDFDLMIGDKKDEVKAAEDRLIKIKLFDTDEAKTQRQFITEDITRINADVDELTSKKQEGDEQISSNQTQVESAKLIMFNTANVLMPFLNAFETIEAQSLKVQLLPNLIQMEMVIK